MDEHLIDVYLMIVTLYAGFRSELPAGLAFWVAIHDPLIFPRPGFPRGNTKSSFDYLCTMTLVEKQTGLEFPASLSYSKHFNSSIEAGSL